MKKQNSKTGLILLGAAVVAGTAYIFSRKSNGGGGGGETGIAYVSGSLTYGDYGHPIPSATVSIGNKSAVTNDQGIFHFPDSFSPGPVTIEVDAEGFNHYAIDEVLIEGDNNFPLYLSSENPIVASISGTITDNNGQPISDAQISLSNQGTIELHSNANGFFQFTQLQAGLTLNWVVSKSGYASKSGTITTVAGINPLNVVLDLGQTYGPAFSFGQITGGVNPDNYSGLTSLAWISITITNNSGQVAKHKIGTYCDYYAQPYTNTLDYDDAYCSASEKYIQLDPGQSFFYNYDARQSIGQGGFLAVLYQNYADFFVMDELGNKSGTIRLMG
jgi:hypothetical protein